MTRPIAPATFLGYQQASGRPPLALYVLTAAIPGHPADSTVSGPTLVAAGYQLPVAHICDLFCDERQGGRRCPEMPPSVDPLVSACHGCGGEGVPLDTEGLCWPCASTWDREVEARVERECERTEPLQTGGP